jgi:hypothetical protein
MMSTRTACRNKATSNASPVTKRSRLSEARLQAESSRNIYSEHGLAVMRPERGQVPCLPLVGGNRGTKNSHPKTCLLKHSLQPNGHIMLSGDIA